MTKTIRYAAIHRLESDLTANNIPHVFAPDGDGYKIVYPSCERSNVRCVVREHRFSIGHEDDKLEMVGLLTEEEKMADTGTRAAVCGNLTKEEVFKRILNDIQENKQ